MTDERTYTDEEVEAILALALTPDATERPLRTGERGLTLAALQEVGREVGVAAERISAAAHTVELRRHRAPRETSLGMPVSVGQAMTLPRPLSDTEWDAVVALLQQTFRARGLAASVGQSRAWTNGNLRVAIDTTPLGTQLGMSTRKGGARDLNRIGLVAFGVATAMLGTVVAGMSPPLVEQVLLWSTTVGAAALVSNLFRLRRWARARERQMEGVARSVRAMLDATSPPREG